MGSQYPSSHHQVLPKLIIQFGGKVRLAIFHIIHQSFYTNHYLWIWQVLEISFFFNVALMSADAWGFKEMMENQRKKKCFIKVEF